MCDKGGYTSSDKEWLAAPLPDQRSHTHPPTRSATHPPPPRTQHMRRQQPAGSGREALHNQNHFIIGLCFWCTDSLSPQFDSAEAQAGLMSRLVLKQLILYENLLFDCHLGNSGFFYNTEKKYF